MAKVKEVVTEVALDAVVEVAPEAMSMIKLELLNIRKGIDYIAHKLGITKFEDGSAEVTAEEAAELVEVGIAKTVE